MTQFAFVPDWVTNWLTPLWLISVGTLVGLVLLFLLWMLAFILSKVPAIGRMASGPGRTFAVSVASAVMFLIIGGSIVAPNWSAWQSLVTSDLLENLAVALGASLVLAVVAGLAVVHFTSQRTVSEVPDAIREGALWPIFIAAICLSAFAIFGTFIAFKPQELLASLARTPFVGPTQYIFTIPGTDFDVLGDAKDPPQNPIGVEFRVRELREITFVSSESLTVDIEPAELVDLDPAFRVDAGETSRLVRTDESLSPFDKEEVDTLYVRNYGVDDAVVSVNVVTRPTHPEVWSIIITACSVTMLFLLYILQRSTMPRASAVALATLKSEIAQPLFAILMILGAVALILFIWIPYNTFGEDIKMLKDSGMTLIMVLCIIQAIWASSTSIADEIDGRTALTVLSKPIGRRSFIIGKFLGIGWTVAVMFIVLGLIMLFVVAYKPIYDAREGSDAAPTWQMCHLEMVTIIPGLVLAFMETLVLAALSVAISTRIPMLGNFIICFTIYVLGHLTPLLVQSSRNQFEAVTFIANLLATVLPILDHFNIQAAIAGGTAVPYDYLGWALIYCMIYGAIALLLALVLFEDRDLA